MKKLLFLLVIFAALPAFAQKTLEVAYESSDYSYREPSDHAIGLKGKMQGGSLRYETRMRDSDMFAAFDGRWMGGTTDYDGWLQDGYGNFEKHTASDIGDYYYEARLHIGQIYDFSQEMKLWLSAGVGYRYLKDHMNKDPYGYLRESSYVYIPFTLNLRYTGSWWSAVLGGEFDYMILGHQTSHFDYPFEDIRNDQNDGFGVRVGLKLQADLSEKTGIFVEPFYRYWQIAGSKEEYR